MPKITKARFWTGVLYPENMREDWEITIGDVVQYPYAYCKHTRDKDSKSDTERTTYISCWRFPIRLHISTHCLFSGFFPPKERKR